ncbi:hypothetical protein DAQ1742_03798 [Dickeya aquatica]|uniref:Uncharacterized protein n=1 Tax=Dickeya aquatica TaxID=1401087 RepID=A0A375AFC7_9GAMM|nr:hypothetical protein DAQ1742_03798 [Dickeya aquatica]
MILCIVRCSIGIPACPVCKGGSDGNNKIKTEKFSGDELRTTTFACHDKFAGYRPQKGRSIPEDE